MKIFTRLLFFVIATLFLISSCSNELNVVDNYKETPVVYGLLNPNSSTQYIRIQKAFLGAGNSLIMAQQHDSIYYDSDLLDISVQQFKTALNLQNTLDTIVTTTYLMTPTFSVIKDEGLFTNQGHVMLKSDNFRPDPNFQYRFLFHNKSTGKRDTAFTSVIGPLIQETLGSSTKVNIANANPYVIRISTASNGRVYGLLFRFKYVTINTLLHDTVRSHIDIPLPIQTSSRLDGSEVISFLLDGTSVYQTLGIKIPALPANTIMTAILGDYIFTCGTDEFYNYYIVNSPSNTVDYIPEFTNLKNGSKGIFTSRSDTTISDIPFSNSSLDSLFNGQYTSHIFQ